MRGVELFHSTTPAQTIRVFFGCHWSVMLFGRGRPEEMRPEGGGGLKREKEAIVQSRHSEWLGSPGKTYTMTVLPLPVGSSPERFRVKDETWSWTWLGFCHLLRTSSLASLPVLFLCVPRSLSDAHRVVGILVVFSAPTSLTKQRRVLTRYS